MSEIIPAILPKDFVELEDKVSLVNGLVKNVQIDICDGKFTREASWPYHKNDDFFEKIIHEEQGLPYWQTLNYEFDLMVNSPEDVVEQWLSAGASRIVLHVESKGDIQKAISILNNRVEIGLALNIDTVVETITSFKDDVQFIQCMGIKNIGFQGQDFDKKVLDKIKEIKDKFGGMTVSVDGGVSLDNATRLISAGTNRLVIGSAIFDSDNMVEAIRSFQKLSHKML